MSTRRYKSDVQREIRRLRRETHGKSVNRWFTFWAGYRRGRRQVRYFIRTYGHVLEATLRDAYKRMMEEVFKPLPLFKFLKERRVSGYLNKGRISL